MPHPKKRGLSPFKKRMLKTCLDLLLSRDRGASAVLFHVLSVTSGPNRVSLETRQGEGSVVCYLLKIEEFEAYTTLAWHKTRLHYESRAFGISAPLYSDYNG
jgi:hypothetical protein